MGRPLALILYRRWEVGRKRLSRRDVRVHAALHYIRDTAKIEAGVVC